MKKYLFSVIVVVFLCTNAFADTQTKIVGTGVNDASVGEIAFTLTGNVTADDGTFLGGANGDQIQDAEESQRLKATMSGNVFTIPAGATIDSIRVEIEINDRRNMSEGLDLEVKLLKAGVVSGTDQSKTTAVPNPMAIVTYAPLDNWGVTLTPSDVNATDFGVTYRGQVAGDNGRYQVQIDFIRITVAYTTPTTLSSAANQSFAAGGAPTAISTLTVIDDISTPTITAANDIRIRIPTGFNMIWDTLDLTATIGGNASAKVSGTVTYEDAGKTLVLDVTTNFAASDTITVAALSFISFTAVSAADNLELVVSGSGGGTAATDDKTITIVAPTFSSALDQTFEVGGVPTAISTQTVADGITPSITTANDIRIRMPTGFNMIWDTLDLTATIGGNASAKVSGTVSYEDAGKTLVINVTTNFVASDTITVAALSFISFTATSAADNLELEVNNDGLVSDLDDKLINIVDLTLSSAANQIFTVGDAATAISTLTIIDDILDRQIRLAKDIRIRIPTGFNMIWDTLDLTATIGGNASAKVSGTVTYEDVGKTLVLNVTTDFVASDTITVAALSFINFTASSAADNLELEVTNDGFLWDFDDKTITILAPTLSSAANKTFTINDSPTAISTQTVIDDGGTPTITAVNDIRIRIPTGFNMIWDTLDFTATIGGAASTKVSTTVSYEDAGKTLVLNVTTDFAASDTITIAGLSFINFTAASTADNLELVVSGAGGGTAATDDKTITISQLGVSLSNNIFAFGTQPLNTWLAAQNTIITNNGQVAENFVGQLSQFTDGTNNWAISNVANGSDIIRAQFSITSSTGPWTDIAAYDSDFTIATNVAVSGTVTCWFRIQTPTATSSLNQHASTLTVTAVAF